MKDFRQRVCDTKVFLTNGTPHIFIAPKAMEQMFHLVSLADQEVGWFGTVSEDPKNNCYRIDEVFLLKQAVGDTTHEIAAEALSDLAEQFIAQYGAEKGIEMNNKLTFWGHSHVNMKAIPSRQDSIQMWAWAENDLPYIIRGIFNKEGDIHFTIAYFKKGIVVNDVPWSIYYPLHAKVGQDFAEEFKTKITKIKEFKSAKWYTRSIKKAQLLGKTEIVKQLQDEFEAMQKQAELEAYELAQAIGELTAKKE